MKRMLKALTATLVIATALTISVAAASFDHCADALADMGLFKGGTSGYELDRAPTRAEAATMLVRLLGKETEAQATTYTAPFTDLDDWQKPYVQYLYENKLTNGATATTFEPEAQCSAQMYTTFLLRSLGYAEAENDFTYNTAMDKAKEIGLVDAVNCNEKSYLRDHVVAMSYYALAEAPKGETATTLLDQLVADGAIDKTKAQPTQDFFKTFAEYATATAAMNQETKMEMKVDMTASVKANGTKMMDMSMDTIMKADMNLEKLDDSKFSMIGTTKMEMDPALVEDPADAKLETKQEVYFADGVYYMNMLDQKIKMPMSFAEAQEMIGEAASVQSEPMGAIKSIEKTTSGGQVTYKLVYAPATMNGRVQSIAGGMEIPGVEKIDMQFGKMDCEMIVKSGKVTDMNIVMDLSMTQAGQKMDMSMTMKTKIIATGDSVKVTMPTDLASYVEMPAA